MSEALAAVGVVLAATTAAAAILLSPGRHRAAAMLVALALFPALILGDQWHSAQIEDLRGQPAVMIALTLVAAVFAVGLLAAAFRRWPIGLPLAIVFALPFRVPLHAGGDTANLLVPLYVVIAAGVVSAAIDDLRCPQRYLGRPQSLPLVLAGVVVLYAIQVLYSADFSKGLQNVCFFFVPFSLVYALLRHVDWDRRLLIAVLWVVALEAVAFVAVGSVEYLSRSLFWNEQVIRANEFHTYFRVNSVFWDPNIYGRYLALAIVIAMAALLWARDGRTLALLAATVAVLWIGLLPTFSQSSFAALLAGLATLAALRWSARLTALAVVASIVALMVVVTLTGSFSWSRINPDTSGRAHLVSGGLDLFGQRPAYGYGSGSFPKAYREHAKPGKAPVSVSHTEPITVAAEQGAIGIVGYVALIATALWTLTAGLRDSLSELIASRGTGEENGGPAAARSDRIAPSSVSPTIRLLAVARAAVLATFVALLVHTMAYAGFYEDPITWVLLAAGVSLAAASPVRPAA